MIVGCTLKMRTSSEIITVSKRAAKASGFSWGVAEEIGKNINLLEMFNLSGIENFNQYLKEKDSLNLDIKFDITNLSSNISSLSCPIFLGIYLLDNSNKVLDLKKLKLSRLAYPLIFLPFMQRISYNIGKSICLNFDDVQLELHLNNTLSINQDLKRKIIKSAESVTIEVLENEDSFSNNVWEELHELSTNTFVEENERLKSNAAGAGLVDND